MSNQLDMKGYSLMNQCHVESELTTPYIEIIGIGIGLPCYPVRLDGPPQEPDIAIYPLRPAVPRRRGVDEFYKM